MATASRSFLPSFREIPVQLRKGPDESWGEYAISLFVTVGMLSGAVAVLLSLAAFLGLKGASSLLLDTTVPFPVAGVGEVNLFRYLIMSGMVMTAPLALQAPLVADRKRHLVDDANSTILFNTVALVLTVAQSDAGYAAFVVAAGYTVAAVWGVLFVLRVVGGRASRRLSRS